ncbi:MAG: UvrB/UvrC motif-containing protein [Acidobacteriaceae bacterium]
MLEHALPFDPQNPDWAGIPAAPAVFALFSEDDRSEPYLNRTPNLRRRLRRLLSPAPGQTKRLQLAALIRRIEFTLTGSEFEALFTLYHATSTAFGPGRASQRLHLRAPVFLRMASGNDFPRVYPSTRLTLSAAADLFGPFPSRWLAERWLESMLNLFLLRRCQDDLHPDPSHPGCIYSELKKCLAPCFQGCTPERYAQEAAAVHDFLATRGQSLLTQLTKERDAASEALDFEQAAALHAKITQIEEVIAALPEAVHPLPKLSGLILQPSAQPETVTLFLIESGQLAGPVAFSTHGMRHPNEQSGSSSLFAHPTMLEPTPLEAGPVTATRDQLETRLDQALQTLRQSLQRPSAGLTSDHLALFRRWFYRPAAKRSGELILAQMDDSAQPAGTIPAKAALRAISRVYRAAQSPAESATTPSSTPSAP